MTAFQPDASFARRRRGGGDRRSLAAVLPDTGGAAAAASSRLDVFTRTAAAEREARAPGPDAEATASAPEREPDPATTPADAVEAEAAAATPAPETALTLDDDDLAGLLAGAAVEARAAAAAEVQQRLAEAEATLAEAFGREVAARERARGETAELILALVRTITEHVVPHAAAAAPLDDLGRELPALLARLEAPEEVTVAVHPDLAEDLQTRLAALAAQAGFTGSVTAEADAALVPGDAVVRWPGGAAGRHLATRIDEAVRLAAGWLAERDTTERAEAPAATTTTEGCDEH